MENAFILEAGTWFLFVGTPPPAYPLPTAYGMNPNKNKLTYSKANEEY